MYLFADKKRYVTSHKELLSKSSDLMVHNESFDDAVNSSARQLRISTSMQNKTEIRSKR